MGSEMELCKHARERAQKRGVSPMAIDLLLRFGARERDGRGAEICYFDRRAKRRLKSYAGDLLGKMEGILHAYIVVTDETVVTAGVRFKRINHR